MSRASQVLTVTLSVVAASAILSVAGPLDPPAGPVAGTYKTLGEFEPRTRLSAATTPGDSDSVYRITAPGSYYLGENMAAPAGKAAIEIASSDVVLDLGGFTLDGSATTLYVVRAFPE